MADFGDWFVNIISEARIRAPVRSVNDYTDRLQEAIELILASPTRRGTIWFPPQTYLIRTNRTIPAEITLSFSPGALMVPIVPADARPPTLSESAIQIAGAIDAAPRAIFATSVSFPYRVLPGFDVGLVVFVGNRVSRVFPEWWGASRLGVGAEPLVDSRAIQSAVDAAILNREKLGGSRSPSIAVYFGGRYTISEQISVVSDDPAHPVQSVQFDGVAASEGAPTVQCSTAFAARIAASESQMFRFSNVREVMLRGISFDANGADRCVLIDCSLERTTVKHSLSVSGCSFVNARAAQVVFRDESLRAPASGAIEAVFRNCRFDGIARQLMPPFRDHPFGTEHVAISFYAPYAARLGVDGCAFRGLARRAVRAFSARVDLVGCSFDISESSEVLFQTATDVELTQAPVSEPRFATLSAVGCRSASPSFVRVTHGAPSTSKTPDPEALRAPSVVLSGIVHDYPSPLGNYRPPAVIWEEAASRSFPSGASMSLIGCSLSGGRRGGTSQGPSNVEPISGVVPLARVFITRDLKEVHNAGTFQIPIDAAFAFVTFGSVSPGIIRSLGSRGSTGEPAPLVLNDHRSDPGSGYRLLLAWATWLWE